MTLRPQILIPQENLQFGGTLHPNYELLVKYCVSSELAKNTDTFSLLAHTCDINKPLSWRNSSRVVSPLTLIIYEHLNAREGEQPEEREDILKKYLIILLQAGANPFKKCGDERSSPVIYAQNISTSLSSIIKETYINTLAKKIEHQYRHALMSSKIARQLAQLEWNKQLEDALQNAKY